MYTFLQSVRYKRFQEYTQRFCPFWGWRELSSDSTFLDPFTHTHPGSSTNNTSSEFFHWSSCTHLPNTNSTPHQLHSDGPSLLTFGFVVTHCWLLLNVWLPEILVHIVSSQSCSLNSNVHWLSSRFVPPILSCNTLIQSPTNSSGGTDTLVLCFFHWRV